jgi:GDP-L-fucose synthase
MHAKIFDLTDKRIYIAGHRGMVGSAIVRRLATCGCEVITAGRDEVDLERQDQAERFLAGTRPDVVVVAAGKVGGIHANSVYPAEFIAKNLAIALNAIHGSYRAGVKKLLFLGSSCIYPKFARQPMSEDELLTGPLEPTNEWYAVAKLPGSSCVKPIAANTAWISYQPYRQTCTAPATITIPTIDMWWPR